ncbi:sodium:solute symporter [bacterium]|nr:sodium:solute symporter [bacterium]
MEAFQLFDWVVVLGYFIVVMGIAWWVIKQKQQTSADYFLASRHIGWFVIGASIFASNIGSEHVVGLAGTAAKTGFVMGHYELHSWIVLMLGWVFVPFYMRSSVFTMPEFLEKRYSSTARWFLSLISLVGYVLTKVSVTVYAGAVVFQTLMGVEFWTGALIIVILTGIYTTLGGLRAVVYTDTLQCIVLVIGAITMAIIGLVKIGGWNELVSILGHQHFNMFRPASDPEFPWVGMVFAPPIAGIWYWCTDQYIVQRTLAAKNEANARRGTIFAAYLKLLPLFIFFIPGLIAFALAQSGKLELASADQAFPTLVKTILPVGLRGLIAGGLLAALMSSLSSVFNSCSTLFTMDIYKKLKPDSSERTLVLVGRIATVVVVASGILWIPLMKYISSELYTYLQSVQSYIAPPIAAAFLLGIFWKRINAKGAVTALIFGFTAGMLRLVLELNKESLSGFLYTIANLNFLYFSISSFLCCIAVMVIVSHLTPKQDEQKIQGLTYATTVAADKKKSRASWNFKDAILSLIVVAIIACILIYFSPIGVGG